MCEIVVLQSFFGGSAQHGRLTDNYRCVERSTTPGGREASLVTFSACYIFTFLLFRPICANPVA